ncbi:pupal cuticle protein 36a-like [Diorhabda carinulata]|uniref:pupal cuticle protein 36a-like n=1 Tax=Diorhabda carinulata TaxID=1163345 RepID=UPI0025A25A79|nr:pupal cuticle protein 36a-like [Diorhabda carinulata]
MRQLIVLFAIIGYSNCGRLDNNYAPSNLNQYSSNADVNGPPGPIDKAANDVPILRLDNDNDGEAYNFALETGNGITAHEQGDTKQGGTNAQGGYSYTAPDGQQVAVQYVAGENGFVAQGSHIPTAPPVPAEIQKALEQNLADEARGIVDDGQYREEGESGRYNHGANHQGFAAYREQANVAKNQYVQSNY